MILHKKDWNDYPDAIVDTLTSNKSFIELALVLKKANIEHHYMILALHNPKLQGVDPFDPDLSEEQMGMIGVEVSENPWYYLRECVRVPAKSGVRINQFKANRGAIALFWLFFNNIPLLLVQPRQTGKTFGTATLFRGLLNFWIINTQINLITKDIKLRTDTVELMKDIESQLPWYLQMTTKSDTDNKEGVTVKAFKNSYKTQIGQSSLPAALNAARGLVSSIFHIDEFGYVYNIRHMLAPALAAGTTARSNAKEDGLPYGTIFTTTSSRRDLDSGAFAYDVYSTGAEYTELLFDIGSKEKLMNYVRKNTTKGNPPIMICEFNHRQLGYTDQWLVTTMEESRSTGIDAEADFFNKWPLGGSKSPLDSKYLKYLSSSEAAIKHLGLSGDGFAIRWYVDENTVKNILPRTHLIIGLDTSDAVGQDDIAMVIRDAKTGEVYGAGQYNDLNTIHFANWLAELLITLEYSVLMPERRSTATTIIDNLIIKLLEVDINPFKRIFNWIVQDKEQNLALYTRAMNGDLKLLETHRKTFGFSTSGSGRTSRTGLFGETLLDSVKFTGGVVNDKRLILQINGLRERNGRVDHGPNEHDDLVIGWLLSYWFLSKAKHVSSYNIPNNTMLSNVVNNSVSVIDDLKEKGYRDYQLRLKTTMDGLLESLVNTSNPIGQHRIVSRLRQLDKQLDRKIVTGVNIESSLEAIIKDKRSNTKRKLY